MNLNPASGSSRSSGAFTGAWMLWLMLLLGALGAGAASQDARLSSDSGFAGVVDPVLGLQSSTRVGVPSQGCSPLGDAPEDVLAVASTAALFAIPSTTTAAPGPYFAAFSVSPYVLGRSSRGPPPV